MDDLRQTIERAYEDPANSLEDPAIRSAVDEAIRLLDTGMLRVAEKQGESWTTHPWVKQAILLYFRKAEMAAIECGPFTYHDKIPLKTDYAMTGVRVVPPATARYGSFIEKGAILMPSYVNIGARVGSGSMVDTWATVGSCAQIGQNVHLSGGVGIGGVLEPPGANPVIIEDGAFIGSRSIVVEGAIVEEEAVLGANVTITSSTPILDVTGDEVVEYRGRIPARSVVVPGTRPKRFPAGEFQLSCALIIGQRKESTDRKTSLESVLRDFGVQV